MRFRVYDSILLSKLKQEWANFLAKYKWDWWATLTFKVPTKDPLIAKRRFQFFIKYLNKLYGAVSYFVAVERFYLSGDCHIHALIGFPQLMLLFKTQYIEPAWKWWFDHYGRAKIDVYDSKKGARFYITKYITKELCDYDISVASGNMS